MAIRVFSVYFFCSIFPLLSGALQIAYHAREHLTAKEQTFSQLRSKKTPAPGPLLTEVRHANPAHDSGSAAHDS